MRPQKTKEFRLGITVLLTEGLHDRVFVNQVESAADMEAAALLAKYLKCPVLAGSLQRGEYTVCSY